MINGKELARLTADENDEVLYFPVPTGRLIDGGNTLAVEAAGKAADDIRVGEFSLFAAPVKDVLSTSTVEIEVIDATDRDRPHPTPCRITVMNRQGWLVDYFGAVGR